MRVVLGALMIGAGILHFATPAPFESMVPAALPAPGALVAVSGLFEILGGAGLFVPRVRVAASYGLVLLYLAVFPANINMALHPELWQAIPALLLWARLPLQLVLVAWALWAGRDVSPAGSSAAPTPSSS
jgi:uncharacterized membrane protein